MTNVVRHAHARSCRVDVCAQDDWLHVTVTDDGVGGVRPRDGGVGLQSMANRAEELGGTCRVLDADPGTRVEVRIPLAPS